MAPLRAFGALLVNKRLEEVDMAYDYLTAARAAMVTAAPSQRSRPRTPSKASGRVAQT